METPSPLGQPPPPLGDSPEANPVKHTPPPPAEMSREPNPLPAPTCLWRLPHPHPHGNTRFPPWRLHHSPLSPVALLLGTCVLCRNLLSLRSLTCRDTQPPRLPCSRKRPTFCFCTGRLPLQPPSLPHQSPLPCGETLPPHSFPMSILTSRPLEFPQWKPQPPPPFSL